MTDHHVRTRNLFRRGAVAAALAGLSLASLAQTNLPAVIQNSSAGFGAWYFAGGAQVGTGGTNVQPIPTTASNPNNLSGWTKAGNFGVAPTATGVTINADSVVDLGGGKVGVKIQSRATPGAALGKFFGATVGGLTGIGTLWTIGNAAYDLARELNQTISEPTPGSIVVTKDDVGFTQSQVDSGAGYFQISQFAPGGGIGTRAVTRTASCDMWATPRQGSGSHAVVNTSGIWNCNIYASNGSLQQTYAIDQFGSPSVIQVPSSLQDLENAIASKSGWPTTSKIDDVIKQGLEKNVPLTIDTPSVSGPASVPGPKQETVKPDGSKEVRQETKNITYQGDKITYNTTVTTNYYNSSNVQTGTQTETKTEETPPEDECKANPDKLACQKLGEPPTEEIPKQTKNITFSAENVGLGGGQCPSPVGWNDSAGSHQISFAYVCDFAAGTLRPIVLAFALLTAYFIVAGAVTRD